MNSAEQLAALSPIERRRLARHECAWCGMPLNRAGCGGAIECSDDNRVSRRADCLGARVGQVARGRKQCALGQQN